MAKFTITYKCGHEDRVNITGKESERQGKVDAMEARICRECYNAQRNLAAAADAEKAGLPELSGSDKQIAWAVTLRQEASADVARWIDERAAKMDAAEKIGHDPADIAAGRKLNAAVGDLWAGRLEREISASYWIDNRHRGGIDHIRELTEEAGA